MPNPNINAIAPFDRGKTYFDGNTTDGTSGAHLLGQTVTFDDRSSTATNGLYPLRTGASVTLMAVRNESGISLLPGRAVTWVAGKRYRAVDGYCTTTDQEVAGIVDEFYPTGGVADDDIFYIAVRGPCLWLTDLAAAAGNSFSEGADLGALTAATSQATTAGRLAASIFTGATAPLANAILRRVGRAMSANTTNQTNRKVLVDLTLL